MQAWFSLHHRGLHESAQSHHLGWILRADQPSSCWLRSTCLTLVQADCISIVSSAQVGTPSFPHAGRDGQPRSILGWGFHFEAYQFGDWLLSAHNCETSSPMPIPNLAVRSSQLSVIQTVPTNPDLKHLCVQQGCLRKGNLATIPCCFFWGHARVVLVATGPRSLGLAADRENAWLKWFSWAPGPLHFSGKTIIATCWDQPSRKKGIGLESLSTPRVAAETAGQTSCLPLRCDL